VQLPHCLQAAGKVPKTSQDKVVSALRSVYVQLEAMAV
jgi:hypothetical protein